MLVFEELKFLAWNTAKYKFFSKDIDLGVKIISIHLQQIVLFFRFQSIVTVANIGSAFFEEKRNLLFEGKEFNFAFVCNVRIISDNIK